MKLSKIANYIAKGGKKLVLSCLPLMLGVLTGLGVGTFAPPAAHASNPLLADNPIEAIEDAFGPGTGEQIEGKVKKDIGTVQRNLGKASGQIEGAAKQVKGSAEQGIGQVKNKVDRDIDTVQRNSDKAASELDDASDNVVDAVKDFFGQ
ncbi:MAG: CsbD family protein [Cyanobacteriota bacterium]|nr:CsbD family protein [Cyanobacteriota bacterium]